MVGLLVHQERYIPDANCGCPPVWPHRVREWRSGRHRAWANDSRASYAGRQRQRKGDAFLNVELFSKVYEQFKGGSLPPESGLKNLFQQTYKILPDRVPQAVRVFLSSAEQAGFFRAAGDKSRLVKPTVHSAGKAPSPELTKKDEPAGAVLERPRTHATDGAAGVHTAIIGLLRDLPPPGTNWSPKKKQRFLDAFKAAIDHIYPEDDE